MRSDNKQKGSNLRELREKQGSFHIGIVINWWLIPGFIGMLGTIIVGKVMPLIFQSLAHGRTFKSSFSHLYYDLGKEFDLLLDLEMQQTNLWVFLLFGFILGVFIKYVYSD